MDDSTTAAASRITSTPKPKIVTSLILGVGLFAGFAGGMSITPTRLAELNPFRMETIAFHKISWLSNENFQKIEQAPAQMQGSYEALNTDSSVGDVSFVPYQLNPQSPRKFLLKSFANHRGNFLKLQQVAGEIADATEYNAFSDYQVASTRMKNEFTLAVNETPALPAGFSEQIAMTKASTEQANEGVAQAAANTAAVDFSATMAALTKLNARNANPNGLNEATSARATGVVKSASIAGQAHEATVVAARDVVAARSVAAADAEEAPQVFVTKSRGFSKGLAVEGFATQPQVVAVKQNAHPMMMVASKQTQPPRFVKPIPMESIATTASSATIAAGFAHPVVSASPDEDMSSAIRTRAAEHARVAVSANEEAQSESDSAAVEIADEPTSAKHGFGIAHLFSAPKEIGHEQGVRESIPTIETEEAVTPSLAAKSDSLAMASSGDALSAIRSSASKSLDSHTVSTQSTLASIPSEEEAPVTITSSSALSPSEQKNLTNTLLSMQLKALPNAPVGPVTTSATGVTAIKTGNGTMVLADNTRVRAKAEAIVQKIKADEEDEDGDADEVSNEGAVPTFSAKTVESKALVGGGNCAGMASHSFVRPTGPAATDVATQVCPTSSEWLSKSLSGSSWVKVQGEGFNPTLTLDPAPNGGSTVLLDDNSVGFIAIKAGVRITKGMGMILGLVPEGYKADFAGRAEETQYFDSAGKSYFVIINAEPGAGVVEIASKTDPNVSTTVFAPVLDDTVTYLDLVTPVDQTINVKVVKNGTDNDSEVAKLTVGVSTQQSIQAITQASGKASLKNVKVIPGFPAFVDVSSRKLDEQSYTYRYEIKNPTSKNTHVLTEVSDKTIHHWLTQVQQGLSDQSAMVVGIYNRAKLDGFKNFHYTQVVPLTAKFGLEPINYSVLWDGKISQTDPLEGDVPRFMSVQVPEGLSQVRLNDENRNMVISDLIPVSPRVIHMIAE